ncbi:MAG: hypothetical protein QOH64_3617 [Acidimicrobiaceae bacterium]
MIVGLALLAVLAFVAGFLAARWWSRRAAAPDGSQADDEPLELRGTRAIPSALPARELGTWLAPRLVGSRASREPGENAALPDVGTDVSTTVVWVDGADEALVHLDSVSSRAVGTTLVMSLDLETDETGRAPVIVRFAMGAPDDPGGLVCATDEVPHGPPALVSRWGDAVQAALWSSLLNLAVDHAGQRGASPAAMGIADGRLVMRTTEAEART